MRKRLIAGMLSAASLAPVAVPTVAAAQHYDGDQRGGDYRGGYRGNGPRGGPGGGDYHWNGDQGRGWDPSRHYAAGRGDYADRRLGRGDRIYRGGDGRYYCRRNDGTTGLVLGAIGGGVLGGVIGGDTLGALVGAGGGALLGRAVDRGQVRCR